MYILFHTTAKILSIETFISHTKSSMKLKGAGAHYQAFLPTFLPARRLLPWHFTTILGSGTNGFVVSLTVLTLTVICVDARLCLLKVWVRRGGVSSSYLSPPPLSLSLSLPLSLPFYKWNSRHLLSSIDLYKSRNDIAPVITQLGNSKLAMAAARLANVHWLKKEKEGKFVTVYST